jgi:hypothetical protein
MVVESTLTLLVLNLSKLKSSPMSIGYRLSFAKLTNSRRKIALYTS